MYSKNRQETSGSADAFATLFAGCEADPECRPTYPDLETVFYEMVRQFATEPIRVSTANGEGREIQAWFTDDDLITGAFESLYDQSLIPILPLAAYQISNGDQKVIEALGAQTGDFGIAEGLFHSVVCHDEVAFFDAEEFQVNVAEHPRLAGYWEDYDTDLICDLWGAGLAAPTGDEAVHSEISALILAGQYVPVTPPRYGQETAATLSQGYFYESPGLTHGVTFHDGCPAGMVATFMEDPTGAPDASCISAMGGMPFVTDLYLNPGIYTLPNDILLAPSPQLLSLVALCGLLLLSAVAGLPTAYLLARRRGTLWTIRTLLVLAVVLLWLAVLLDLAFAVGLVLILQEVAATSEDLLLFGLPSSTAVWFLLPWVAAVSALLVVPGWWAPGSRAGGGCQAASISPLSP